MGEAIRRRGKKEGSDDHHDSDRKGHKNIAESGRNVGDAVVSDEYLDKEPPIQFALFLIAVAALFTVFTVCINYARTSGWFDKFGKT